MESWKIKWRALARDFIFFTIPWVAMWFISCTRSKKPKAGSKQPFICVLLSNWSAREINLICSPTFREYLMCFWRTEIQLSVSLDQDKLRYIASIVLITVTSWDVIAFVHVRRWSSRPTVTNDRQPFGMRTNDMLVAIDQRPTTDSFLCYILITWHGPLVWCQLSPRGCFSSCVYRWKCCIPRLLWSWWPWSEDGEQSC